MKSERIYLITLLFIIPLFVKCQNPDAWEERQNSRQPPEKVMDVMGIKPGMIIGEVGAGRGRFAVQMAKRVGPSGKVYANDIDKSALQYLDHRCKRDNIPNIVSVLGELTDPKLPEGLFDVIYIVNTYHHIDDKVAILRNLLPALKEEGKLIIIENEPKKSGWESSHSTPEKVVIEEAKEAGFDFIEVDKFLELDNIYFFRPSK